MAVTLYILYPLSLRNVEDVLFARGIDISYETVRYWWDRFGPLLAADIRRQRVSRMRGRRHWRWHLDEMYVRINGERHYLWRAADHEGGVLESFVTKKRDKAAALTFMKKALKRHGNPYGLTSGSPLLTHFTQQRPVLFALTTPLPLKSGRLRDIMMHLKLAVRSLMQIALISIV